VTYHRLYQRKSGTGFVLQSVNVGDWDLGGPPPPSAGQSTVTHLRGRSIFNETPPPPGSRDLLVRGAYIPTPATAGVLRELGWGRPGIDAGATQFLTEVFATGTAPVITYGDTTTTRKLVENKWVTSMFNITGRAYDFKNCWFAGNWQNHISTGRAYGTNSMDNTFTDCTFQPQNPQWDSQAFYGNRFTMLRCHCLHMPDGIAHIGQGASYTNLAQDIKVYQSLFERAAFISPDQGANGGANDNRSHLDLCCQMRGGLNFEFIGNAMYSFCDPAVGYGGVASVDLPSGTHVTGWTYPLGNPPTGTLGPKYALSNFMWSPVLGDYGNVLISDNWMDGGQWMFNMGNPAIAAGAGGIRIINNNFGRLHGQSGGAGIMTLQAGVQLTYSGNKYYYTLSTNPVDDTEPNDIPGLPVGNFYRKLNTGLRSTWPDANLSASG
jgi:hypothetical protein